MENNQPVKIVPSVLAQQVHEGMKLDALATHYGLPKTQMKKALQQLGLKIRKFHKPAFVFEEEETTGNVEEFSEELQVMEENTEETEELEETTQQVTW